MYPSTFKTGGGEKTAQTLGVPFLGRIPIDPKIVQLADEGKPFVTHNPDSAAAKAFNDIVEKIIAISNNMNENPRTS